MLIVRATKKLLRLAGPSTAPADDRGTTSLGPWYATVLFWRPRVVLLVNETTLLPVLLPLAPAATLLTSRIAEQICTVLTGLDAPAAVIDQERRHMQTALLGATANRSVVGVMTDFTRLAEIHHDAEPTVDLVALAVRLAATPCSPLYRRNVSPDRELAATLQTIMTDAERSTGHVHR